MKKLLIICVLFSLCYQESFGQCITLAGMRSMFFKNMDAQDKYMTAKGFELIDGEDGKGYIWANKKLGRVSADIDNQSKVWQIEYHPPSLTCFNSVKAEVSAMAMKKDAQFFKENFVHYFYSNDKYGIEMYRFSSASGVAYYVSVMRKAEYEEEKERVRNM